MKSKKPTAKRLPNKLSALMRLALADLCKAEKDARYFVDMGRWHSPGSAWGNPCSVCLAGSVMAFSLGANPKRHLWPEEFSDRTCNKLRALNWLRQGYVANALGRAGKGGRSPLGNSVRVVPYAKDRRKFKRDMRRIAAMLERRGL